MESHNPFDLNKAKKPEDIHQLEIDGGLEGTAEAEDFRVATEDFGLSPAEYEEIKSMSKVEKTHNQPESYSKFKEYIEKCDQKIAQQHSETNLPASAKIDNLTLPFLPMSDAFVSYVLRNAHEAEDHIEREHYGPKHIGDALNNFQNISNVSVKFTEDEKRLSFTVQAYRKTFLGKEKAPSLKFTFGLSPEGDISFEVKN